MGKRIRKHITFYGQVQGVGFRWRTIQAANMYNCTGWVRNEWNETVTMEIQGLERDIDQVILSIEAGRYIHIDKIEEKTLPLTEEKGFHVR